MSLSLDDGHLLSTLIFYGYTQPVLVDGPTCSCLGGPYRRVLILRSPDRRVLLGRVIDSRDGLSFTVRDGDWPLLYQNVRKGPGREPTRRRGEKRHKTKHPDNQLTDTNKKGF